MKIFLILLLSPMIVYSQERAPSAVSTPAYAFITDRADKTEGPFTVEPGRFQLEADLLSYTFNKEKKEEGSETLFNNMNVKLGLFSQFDIEFILPTVVQQTTKNSVDNSKQTGLGDAIIRTKTNIVGNDAKGFALGIINYVKFPTAGAGMTNNQVEGGFLIPVAMKVWTDWDLGLMVQFDHLKKEDGNSWQTDYVASIVLGKSLTERLGAFVELYAKCSDNKKQHEQLTADFGFTYLVTHHIQLDAGLFIGLTDASDDYTTFTGFSIKF